MTFWFLLCASIHHDLYIQAWVMDSKWRLLEVSSYTPLIHAPVLGKHQHCSHLGGALPHQTCVVQVPASAYCEKEETQPKEVALNQSHLQQTKFHYILLRQ